MLPFHCGYLYIRIFAYRIYGSFTLTLCEYETMAWQSQHSDLTLLPGWCSNPQRLFAKNDGVSCVLEHGALE